VGVYVKLPIAAGGRSVGSSGWSSVSAPTARGWNKCVAMRHDVTGGRRCDVRPSAERRRRSPISKRFRGSDEVSHERNSRRRGAEDEKVQHRWGVGGGGKTLGEIW